MSLLGYQDTFQSTIEAACGNFVERSYVSSVPICAIVDELVRRLEHQLYFISVNTVNNRMADMGDCEIISIAALDSHPLGQMEQLGSFKKSLKSPTHRS